MARGLGLEKNKSEALLVAVPRFVKKWSWLLLLRVVNLWRWWSVVCDDGCRYASLSIWSNGVRGRYGDSHACSDIARVRPPSIDFYIRELSDFIGDRPVLAHRRSFGVGTGVIERRMRYRYRVARSREYPVLNHRKKRRLLFIAR